MSKKLTKDEIRNPDQLTAQLQKSFNWSVGHSKTVLALAAAFLVLWGGYALYAGFSESKEQKVQEKLYLAEKDYLTTKQNFEDAEKPEPAVDDKKAKSEPKKDSAKVKASGDLQKDYGPTLEKFNQIIASNPDSKAALMAALYSSEILGKYNQNETALSTLKKVTLHKDLLSTLVLNRTAALQADMNNCAEAIKSWDTVIKNKDVAYLHNEAKLRQALCHESMNNVAQAEKIYAELQADTTKSESSKLAAKYLRLIKVKTN